MIASEVIINVTENYLVSAVEFSTCWVLYKGTLKLIYRLEMQIQDCEWLHNSLNVRSRTAVGGTGATSGWKRAQVRNWAATAQSRLYRELTMRLLGKFLYLSEPYFPVKRGWADSQVMFQVL